MQAWTFEGSSDNVSYTMLDNKAQNTYLKSNGVGKFGVNPSKKCFRYFRIKQTMNTIKNSYGNMRISGLDLFGLLISDENTYRSTRFSFIITKLILSILVLS